MTPSPRIYALIVAAGTGSRVGGAVPKQYQAVAGKPLVAHSAAALAVHPAIAGVQVVIHPEHRAYYDEAVGLGRSFPLRGKGGMGPNVAPALPNKSPHLTSPLEGEGYAAAPLAAKLLPPVLGGAERTDSVRAGLQALAVHQPDYVLIHDAARPFLSAAMIDELIRNLTPEQAVLPALAVADTVRRFDGALWHEVSRDGLLRVQTPQCFPFSKLREVMETRATGVKAPSPLAGEGSPVAPFMPTDEAAVWLEAGGVLRYVDGDESLRKVTTAADIQWAQNHAASRRVAVGMGFDVHALMPAGEKHVIRLGGIDIQHNHKLHGHSDADVVLHAIVDALLGAIAEGDIGSHFPPTDARWKGANSAVFIEEARSRVAYHGGVISHVDVTIIGEQPKISPHRDAMREAIARLLQISVTRVSVKATTTEKLGFTGRDEGIACQAVATITLPEAA